MFSLNYTVHIFRNQYNKLNISQSKYNHDYKFFTIFTKILNKQSKKYIIKIIDFHTLSHLFHHNELLFHY